MTMPSARADVSFRSNGLSHDNDGSTEPGRSPASTLYSATPANATSTMSSAASRKNWVRAFSSMPITQMTVIRKMKITPTRSTHHLLLARSSQPKSRKSSSR